MLYLKKRVIALIIFLSSFLIFFLFFDIFHSKKHGSTSVEVTVDTIQIVPVVQPLLIESIGRVESNYSTILKAQESGLVRGIFFKDGQSVQVGKLLMQIDNAQYIANLKLAEAKFELAKINYSRSKSLEAMGAIARQDGDTAFANYKATRAAVDAIQAQLVDKQVVAPFDGVLGRRLVNLGAYVNIGDPLVKISNDADLKILYTLPQDVAFSVKIGQEVKVSSESLPNKLFCGKVFFVAPEIDQATGTIDVEANIESRGLKPGMFVKVQQVVDPDRKLFLVPESSVLTDDASNYVYKVTGGVAQKQSVVTGQTVAGSVQVLNGLTSGDRIVVTGQDQLQDGEPVMIKQGGIKS